MRDRSHGRSRRQNRDPISIRDGVGRSAVDFVCLKLGGVPSRRIHALLVLLSRCSRLYKGKSDKEYTCSLPADLFNRSKTYKDLINQMECAGLLRCERPHAWKKTYFQKPKKKRYMVDPELVWKIRLDPDKVFTPSEYQYGIKPSVYIPKRSKVILHKDSPVKMPRNIIERLEQGTGFGFDVQSAWHTFQALPEADRPNKVSPLAHSVGADPRHIVPEVWEQKKGGRIYAHKPNVQGMPKVFRKHLQPLERGTVTAIIDAKSLHGWYPFKDTNELPDETDRIYDLLAMEMGPDVTAKEVKSVYLPMLNGQTEAHLKYQERMGKITERDLKRVLFLRSRLKQVMVLNFSQAMKRTLGASWVPLQEWESNLMNHCLTVALEEVSMAGFIPMHDGLIFAVDGESDCERVRSCFASASQETEGKPMPFSLELVA